VFWYCLVTGRGQKYTFLSMGKTNNNRNSIVTGLTTLQTNASVYYSGVIDAQVISRLLNEIESCLISSCIKDRRKSEVIAIATELLQNIYHHCPLNADAGKDSPMFLLEEKEDIYMLTTSNLIEKSNAPLLRKQIAELNSYTAEELTGRYREVLNNGKLNNQCAGLGLIDILRKSGNPIAANFETIDNKYTRLTVNVSIPLNK